MLLGEILLWSGKLTRDQIKKALEIQKKTGKMLGQIVVEQGYITEDELMHYLSKKIGVQYQKLVEDEIDKEAVDLVPESLAKKYQLIPVKRGVYEITVAMTDPTNLLAIDEIRFATGLKVAPVLAKQSEILNLIDIFYSKSGTDIVKLTSDNISEFSFNEGGDLDLAEETDSGFDIDAAKRSSEEKPIIQLVNKVIYGAISEKCSDIHFEPYETSFRIRYRIDGVLETVVNPPKKLAPAIISRVKIMSKLDIAERRLPQDGRIRVHLNTKKGRKSIDIRISTIPTVYGEKVVMRLLDKDNLRTDLRDLGLEENDLKKLKNALALPYGIILATGPTGSGKSTTLYAALSTLNRQDVNIMTAEDPVEYDLEGINQVYVKEAIGLTFSAALRSFLRQDPDIIMVGEIRDTETADIAARAALTGHLVLSTIHTNDAPSTITRLIDMGIEPYLIASSLNCIISQRLVRKICPKCKHKVEVSQAELLNIGFNEQEAAAVNIYEGGGCKYCRNSGYRGRIAIYELLEITENIKEAILQNRSISRLREIAKDESLISLRENGLQKIKEGITTISEILRVTVMHKRSNQ
ncbi:MAG: type IV-A pilus assembly ATPase PilB [Epsilonproteobacteria bacterium]|nr:type IV-A pilus assembly ATPase PilB [Campylobacterota bacterium]